MKRYLELKTADADLPWQDDTSIEIKSNLASVLGWMGVCKFIKKIGDTDGDETHLTDVMAMAREAKPKGRVAEMLLAMNEQIPEVEASLDIGDGNIDLQFDDEFDSFEIDLRSRKVVELIKQSGPSEAASALVDDYRLYNSQRSRLLNVFKLAAQKISWKWESGYQHWYFGASLREVAIPLGEELTKALDRSSGDAAGAIKVLLAPGAAFTQACLELISQEMLDAPTISSTPLLPYVAQAPKLVSLTTDIVAKMEAFHQRSLSEHLASDRGLYCYLDRLRYEPCVDVWAIPDDWLRAADRELSREYVPDIALLVLLDFEDDRVQPLLKKRLYEEMLYTDVDEAVVQLAWRHRNLLPVLGKVWFEPCYDNVPHAEYRQRLGDPIAIRQLVVETNFDALNILEWPTNITRMIAEQWITPAQRTKYGEQLLHWARTHYQWEPYRDGPFAAAWALNLHEVMDALEENPYLTEFLLCYNDNRELFAEPGIYLAEKALLYWSLLKPTKLLAQIIASTDPQVFRQANRGTATSLRNLGVDQEELLNHWYRSLKIPLAIAWHRCRQAGVV